jgi:glycosyltransferase involved in cell wall biosynthesis
MQANIPIIAANNSSIPEVLGSDHEGLFSTFNVEQLSSLITKVIVDKAFADQLALRNQERLIRFKPDIMAKQILGVYQEARF